MTQISTALEQIADTAFEHTKEALSGYSFDSNEVYYTFADKLKLSPART
jgi:hypothetical protein